MMVPILDKNTKNDGFVACGKHGTEAIAKQGNVLDFQVQDGLKALGLEYKTAKYQDPHLYSDWIIGLSKLSLQR